MAEAKLRALWRIRMAHTMIWAVFASSIIAIPLVMLAGRVDMAMWLSALVWIEVLVLFVNRMRCPLTALAARFTDDRAPNFDIFLPAWLAKHNQLIFGSLFAIVEICLIAHLALRRI
jgi:hypothetical protein